MPPKKKKTAAKKAKSKTKKSARRYPDPKTAIQADKIPTGVIVEPPQEYIGKIQNKPNPLPKLIISLAALAIILILVSRSSQKEIPQDIATETEIGKDVLMQETAPANAYQQSPYQKAAAAKPANTKPYQEKGIKEMETAEITEEPIEADTPKLDKEEPRTEPFKKMVKVNVRPGPDGAALRIFRDKPRDLVFQISSQKTSGKDTLQWDGTDQDGNLVAPGLYYLNVTDSTGVVNDELWVR